MVESSFFLGTNTRVYPSGQAVSGLLMQFNVGDSVQIIGQAPSCTRSFIGHQAGPLTSASLTVTAANTIRFDFDFTSLLAFDDIQDMSYSVAINGTGFPPRHVARPPAGKQVAVEFESNVSATVYMHVAQCV